MPRSAYASKRPEERLTSEIVSQIRGLFGFSHHILLRQPWDWYILFELFPEYVLKLNADYASVF